MGAQLAALAALAVALVTAAVLAFGYHEPSRPATGAPAGAAEVRALLAGVPQRGNTLGAADAPVTMVEFADLQCPFCRQYHQDVLPSLVQRYVRSGRLRLVFEPLHFIGSDSTRLALAAAAAAPAGRMWNVTALAYANQGAENSGWAGGDLLDRIARAAGVTPSTLRNAAASPAAVRLLDHAAAAAQRAGIDATPSFLLGHTGKPLRRFSPSALSAGEFTAAIDGELGR